MKRPKFHRDWKFYLWDLSYVDVSLILGGVLTLGIALFGVPHLLCFSGARCI